VYPVQLNEISVARTWRLCNEAIAEFGVHFSSLVSYWTIPTGPDALNLPHPLPSPSPPIVNSEIRRES